MSSRSKEKITSAIRKFFKGSSDKTDKTGETNNNNGAKANNNGGPSAASPARRLRRYYKR